MSISSAFPHSSFDKGQEELLPRSSDGRLTSVAITSHLQSGRNVGNALQLLATAFSATVNTCPGTSNFNVEDVAADTMREVLHSLYNLAEDNDLA